MYSIHQMKEHFKAISLQREHHYLAAFNFNWMTNSKKTHFPQNELDYLNTAAFQKNIDPTQKTFQKEKYRFEEFGVPMTFQSLL